MTEIIVDSSGEQWRVLGWYENGSADVVPATSTDEPGSFENPIYVAFREDGRWVV